MSISTSDRTPVNSGADLTFPEYTLKMTRRELLFQSKRKHHRVLAEVMSIARQGYVLGFDNKLEPSTSYTSPESERYLRLWEEDGIYKSYTQLIEILEGLDTETLEFIAESYEGEFGYSYSNLLSNALSPLQYKDAKASGEDINVLVKNVISYRHHVVSWCARDIGAFNDVRASAPQFNRPDLYNITGEDREWVRRIMAMASWSRYYPKDGDTSLHSNHEIATLIKDDEEALNIIGQLISMRGLKPSEITADLIDEMRTSQTPVLNEGIL